MLDLLNVLIMPGPYTSKELDVMLDFLNVLMPALYRSEVVLNTTVNIWDGFTDEKRDNTVDPGFNDKLTSDLDNEMVSDECDEKLACDVDDEKITE